MLRPLLVLVLLVAFATPTLAARTENGSAFRPTRAENQLAVSIADRSVTERGLRAVGPVYLVSVELVDEKGVPDRQALVTHYRTSGDLTILTTVNLTKGAVTHAEAIPHLPTGLSREELEQARTLALANPEVAAALGDRKRSIVVESIVTRPATVDDPLWGHRLVRLLFLAGEDYLHAPTVIVDLTTSKVLVSQPSRASEEPQQ